MPDTTKQRSGHDETWAYAGVRLDTKNRRIHAWQDPTTGTLRYWSDRGSYSIGSLYVMRVERTGDGIVRIGLPSWASDQPKVASEFVTAWTIESEKTEHHLARDRAERKVKTQGSAIDQAAEGVCQMAASVRTFTELESLISAVRRRMIDAWDKKS